MVHLRFALNSLLFAPGVLSAQFRTILRSTPDSAEVTLNGVVKGVTPCAVNYRWRDAMDGRVMFEVKAPGYTAWVDSITEKPWKFDRTARINLERAIPNYALDPNSAIVGFDKLIADFKDGTVIGSSVDEDGKVEPIEWEGSVKVGARSFENRFYEVLNKAGFRTPGRKDPKLFSDGDQRPQLPRFLVGMQVTEVSVNLRYDEKKHYGEGPIVGTTGLSCDWKVLDRTTGKVMLSVQTKGLSHHRQRSGYVQSDNITAFEDALLQFLAEGRFVEMVRTNVPSVPLMDEESADSTSTHRTIEHVDLPTFNSLGDMIRYADKSCVTVITDGGHGSGVIINREGYVISAHHVVDGTNRVEVQFSDGLRQDASIVFADIEHDLVLLDVSGSGFRPLAMAANDSTGLGEDVITIGTPADLALGQSVSKGILSGKRKLDNKIYLQTDLAVNPGNSGGPLLNRRGEIIGIVQSKLVGEGIEGLGFAVPMEEVMKRLHLSSGVPTNKN